MTPGEVNPGLFRSRVFTNEWEEIRSAVKPDALREILEIESQQWFALGQTTGYFSAAEGTDVPVPVLARDHRSFFDEIDGLVPDLLEFERALAAAQEDLTPSRLEYLGLVLFADDTVWEARLNQLLDVARSVDRNPEDAIEPNVLDQLGWALEGAESHISVGDYTPSEWRTGGLRRMAAASTRTTERLHALGAARKQLGRVAELLTAEMSYPLGVVHDFPALSPGDERRSARKRIAVALIGYGYWGPNLARNVLTSDEFTLAAICEVEPNRAAAASERVAGVPVLPDLDEVLADPNVDAVIVATPPRTHDGIATAALRAGKHVLVEHPLATSSDQANELVDLAERVGKQLMPGHTFLYHPVVSQLGDLIHKGVLGEVFFVTSTRMNLGKYARDGVIWDLAPHDVSILLFLLRERVCEVEASGRAVFQTDVPETAFITVSFPGGAVANLQLSWLSPEKYRQTVIVGSKRMAVWDDRDSIAPLRIYDRGMDYEAQGEHESYSLVYRSGDIISPRVAPVEPLAAQLRDFAQAIGSGTVPRSSAQLGAEVVRVVEAAHEAWRSRKRIALPQDVAQAQTRPRLRRRRA